MIKPNSLRYGHSFYPSASAALTHELCLPHGSRFLLWDGLFEKDKKEKQSQTETSSKEFKPVPVPGLEEAVEAAEQEASGEEALFPSVLWKEC